MVKNKNMAKFNVEILNDKKNIDGFMDGIQVKRPKYDILLIEDDLATILLLKRYFESKGYTCKGVVSGSKGIQELKISAPKIILLDILLPDFSGYDVCKIIKSDKEYEKIPVFFLSIVHYSEVKKNLEETGADGYILKPFNFSDFDVIFDIITEKGQE